jgi:hypothetical protein
MKNFWHLPLENQSLVCQRGCLSRVESTRKNWEWWGLKRPPFSRMRHWAALGPEPQTALPWKQRMQPHKPVHLEATQKTTPVSSPLRSVFEKRQTLLPGIVESWQFTDTLVRAPHTNSSNPWLSLLANEALCMKEKISREASLSALPSCDLDW